MDQRYLLEVNNVSKTIDNFSLHNINFQLEPGYITGIIGVNGAGKTTLLNMLLGIYYPDEGEIIINGYNRVTNALDVKKRIAFITDECLFPYDLKPKHISMMYGSTYPGFDPKKMQSLCKRFGVPYNKTLRKMSKGNRIKMQLAFAMSYDADLYIMDEPTAGLDPVFHREVYEYLFEIVADGTKSILLSTNITEDLDRIGDYVLFLDQGTQKFFSEKEELINKYRLIKGTPNQVAFYSRYIIGKTTNETYTEALIWNELTDYPVAVTIETPTLDKIMQYLMEKHYKKGER